MACGTRTLIAGSRPVAGRPLFRFTVIDVVMITVYLNRSPAQGCTLTPGLTRTPEVPVAQADSARSTLAAPSHVWLIDCETRQKVDWSRFVILDMVERFRECSQDELGGTLDRAADYLCAVTRGLPPGTREKGWAFEAFLILHLLRRFHHLAYRQVIEAKLREAAALLVTGTEYCEGLIPSGY